KHPHQPLHTAVHIQDYQLPVGAGPRACPSTTVTLGIRAATGGRPYKSAGIRTRRWESATPTVRLPDDPITRLPYYPITRLPDYPITRLPDCPIADYPIAQ